MRFVLAPSLVEELQVWRGSRPLDPVEREEDAFCLDPGLGPSLYLTSDGRVLVDGAGWDDTPMREATDAEALAAVVVGARKTGLGRLFDLLPRRPDSALTCTRCNGGRYATLVPGIRQSPRLACPDCHGIGWTVPPGE